MKKKHRNQDRIPMPDISAMTPLFFDLFVQKEEVFSPSGYVAFIRLDVFHSLNPNRFDEALVVVWFIQAVDPYMFPGTA